MQMSRLLLLDFLTLAHSYGTMGEMYKCCGMAFCICVAHAIQMSLCSTYLNIYVLGIFRNTLRAQHTTAPNRGGHIQEHLHASGCFINTN